MTLPSVCGWRVGAVVVLSVAWTVSGPWHAGARAEAPTASRAIGSATDRATAALFEGIRAETLDNGLRVYLKPVPRSPVVTLMVAYKVGSADEDLDNTGLSHYLEHLMFKGTDKIMPGDIDRLTLRNGGTNNASTSEDATIYYFDFAADRWEAALGVEADRMRNLRIDERHEFEQEKGAVIQELQRDEDAPWDLEQKAILPLLFGGKSPYGHPVIGQRQHVRRATAAVIKAHYDKWYHPNNAALVVVGGFDPDKTLAKIKKLFGPIPRAGLPPRKPARTVERTTPVHHEFPSQFPVPRMLMGFNTVRSGDPDYYPLDVIQALLSGGKTSRLYRKLVEGEEVAGEVGNSNSAGRYPGWFSVQVQLLKGKDRAAAEKLVLAELKRLRDEPVGDAELKRVKRNLLANFIFAQEGVHNLAATIARDVTTNDLEFLKTYLPRIAAVTAKDVQATARKYFEPGQRVVVWSVPGTPGEREKVKGESNSEQRRGKDRLSPSRRTAGEQFSLKDVRRVVLDNGLTLLLFENHRLPIFVADAFVRDTRLLEPGDKAGVAALTGRLLDEGTARHSGQDIAVMIEDVGGSLSLHQAGGSVRVLTPDRDLGLGLLFECLTRPAFPRQAFARERQRLLSEIDDAEQEPDSRALMVYRALVYGKHPYGRPQLGYHKTVEELTPADCRKLHQRLFVPDKSVVAVVGDFDSKEVIDEITRLTRSWKKEHLARPDPPQIDKPKQFTQKIVTMPGAAQLHFFMGQAGIRRDNPDYYKLLVMDYVLGTGTGFTDRLSSRLRDRQGLAYTVEANITRTAAEEPGVFTCYIGTDPENFGRVKQIFLEELTRLRKEPPEPAEVEDAQKYLLGSLPFEFTTDAGIAAQLVSVERYHLGFDYLDDYRKKVAAVTPEDVQTVARQYLDPGRMILVAAGAVDKKGRPLARPRPHAGAQGR
ncbi:MAG TPA: pitrilysin family protein [Gemmataceae bacterium]|jgi:zinc protease|nr:pitrilysin family protein [Gemmataceae bacterium]